MSRTLTKEEKVILEAKLASVVKDTSLYTPTTSARISGKQYYKFTCSQCNKEAENTYSDEYYYDMAIHRLCFHCTFYLHLDREMQTRHTIITIIDGHIYTPGNRTTGSFRGMAGRRFDIEYIEPSVYAGQRITTYDLWSGSTMPDWMIKKYPDTARFLGQAKKFKSGEITGWNPSDPKNPAYPLPSSLKPNQSNPPRQADPSEIT